EPDDSPGPTPIRGHNAFEDADETPPPRSRRRTKPSAEIAAEVTDDSPSSLEPTPDLGSPSELPTDDPKPDDLDEKPESIDLPSMPRRRHAPKSNDEEEPAEKSPRLLPVPDKSRDEEDRPPRRRTPRTEPNERPARDNITSDLDGFGAQPDA